MKRRAVEPELSPAIRSHFNVERTAYAWILTCKVCRQRWELKFKGAETLGNLLALLDHARSHDKVRPS